MQNIQNTKQALPTCLCAQTEVKLPFSLTPPIQTYNYSAFLLSTILPHPQNNIPFLLNNYIQLVSPAPYLGSHLLSFIPVVSLDYAERFNLGHVVNLQLNDVKNLKDEIRANLTNGYYIRIVADEWHIPQTPSYQKKHHFHDNLIYGYCSKCDSFSTAGYRAVGDATRFSSSRCSSSNLEIAVTSFPNDKPAPYQDRILLFKPNSYTDSIDVNLIVKSFKCYIEAIDIPHPSPWPELLTQDRNTTNRRNPRFGDGIYDSLLEHFEDAAAGKTFLDIRPFRLVLEHKQIMRNRLIFLSKYFPALTNTLKSYTDVEQHAHATWLTLLDYQQNNNLETLKQIPKSLNVLRSKERSTNQNILEIFQLTKSRPSIGTTPPLR